MFSLAGRSVPNLCRSRSRREFLRVGGLALGGLFLPAMLAAAPNRRAKSCILIFMDGGPSHLETFDVKPNAPLEVRGEFRPIPSSVPGAPVCELLPKLASQMHYFAQVRSVHHSVNDHNAGAYYMLTGHSPVDGGKFIQTDSAKSFPCIGSAVAKLAPNRISLPQYVLLPEYQWNNGVDIGGQKAGFLGPSFDPLVGGDPSLAGHSVPGLNPLPELPLDRLGERGDLQRKLDRAIGSRGDDPATDRLDAMRRRALEIITSPKTRDAFDLTKEPRKLRERYGMDPGTDRGLEARKFGGLPHLGQCFLLARRLVEAGVKLVTVITGRRIDQAWDTHRDHFGLMRRSLCPPFDAALATLVADLHDRGMLDETLLVVMGEFGRTPKIGQITSGAGANKDDGRDHWPHCYTVLFAGGGVPGGAIHGSSDKIAAYPRELPVSPEGVAATVYSLLGIDPGTELRDPFDKPYQLNTGTPIRTLIA
ncbi:MAG: DUF1501 domain-containing protein [Planctomycetia bacterium]|nr:DUF1501 domain-containing protein [Planctomycetia bacterium]